MGEKIPAETTTNVLRCCGSPPCGPSRVSGSCRAHRAGEQGIQRGGRAHSACREDVSSPGSSGWRSDRPQPWHGGRRAGQNLLQPDLLRPNPGEPTRLHRDPVPGQLRPPQLARAPRADVAKAGSAWLSHGGLRGPNPTGEAVPPLVLSPVASCLPAQTMCPSRERLCLVSSTIRPTSPEQQRSAGRGQTWGCQANGSHSVPRAGPLAGPAA